MLSRLIILSAIVPLSIWANQTYDWAGTNTTWTTDTNWTPNSGYPGSNYPTSIDTAVFPTGTVNVMPNLVSAITLTEISFTAGNYEITNDSNSDFLTFVSSGGTAPSIIMSAGVTSNNTIFPPIVLDSNLIITNDSTTAQLYISSSISQLLI